MNPSTYVNKDTSVNKLVKVHITDNPTKIMAHINENNNTDKDGQERDSVNGNQCNCIELNITNVKNDNLITSGIINLDSGNQLLYPVMSGNFYDKLKSLEIIPSNMNIAPSTYTVESANGLPLMVRGMSKYPLKFSNSQDLKFVFNRFLIMDGLTTDINLGKGALDKLKVKWEFSKPRITMLGNFVELCSKSDYTLGNIEIRDEQHIQTRII